MPLNSIYETGGFIGRTDNYGSSGVFNLQGLYNSKFGFLHFKTALTFQTNIASSTSYTKLSAYDTTSGPIINTSGFSMTTGAIKVPVNGIYLCSAHMYHFDPAGGRGNIHFSFGINDVVQDETSGSAYIRGSDDHRESSNALVTLYELNANDEINTYFASLGNITADPQLFGARSSVTLTKVA